MLSDEEFAQWCLRLEIPEPTKKLIQTIRTSPPVRRVQSGFGNMSGSYPSRKMGRSIQFESHKLELAAIYEMEHDPAVLEYYDQPIQIKLKYQATGTKRNVGVIHTPDFFVIWQQGAYFRECKMDDKLVELAEEMSNRYQQAPDGSWSCPPGEAYAAQFKLGYTMYTSSQINWTYQRNMRYLEDYLLLNAPDVSESRIQTS